MKIKKAVAYVRVSTNKQIDNTSIETQREKIELYCKLNDIELVKEFNDEGISAKSIITRKQYNEMMNFVADKENEINAIIVMKADRIHRSLKNLVDMMYMLKEKEIEFISVTENFDTSTAQGMLLLQMLGSFSEFERKVIAERTKSGRIANGKKEIYPGGRPPFGYYLDKGTKKLKINKKEAETVKAIFKFRSKGETLQEIGNRFNMSKQAVDYILKNEIYLGKYRYDGEKEKNNFSWEVEQIISKYLFTKINKL